MAENEKNVLDLESIENMEILNDIDLAEDVPDSPFGGNAVPEMPSEEELLKGIVSENKTAEVDFSFNDDKLDAAFEKFEEEEMSPAVLSEVAVAETLPEAESPQDNGSGYDYDEEQRKQRESLQWYSGKLDDDVFEITEENMPDVLDSSHKITVLQVNAISGYGWNVFFGNGVFMNLRDLAEYQERHGSIPYPGGKIIYGSKTMSFDKIERIVVYESPKYFEYKIQR